MGLEDMGEPVRRAQGPPKPRPEAPIVRGPAKCDYCGLYGPLGRCGGCGAPNKPARALNPLPPLVDVGGLVRK